MRYRFAKNPEKMLKGIDYGIDSNPNFSIVFILFNLAAYSNSSLTKNVLQPGNPNGRLLVALRGG